MKNLLIYTGLTKEFNKEHETLARIQIDNSLDLGWKKDDIVIVTDFPFSYNGVQSHGVPDGLYYDFDHNANKVPVLLYLLGEGRIGDGVYWCHDFDAYENDKIIENELELDGYDIGLTHYTYKEEWQFGSVFIKKQSQDIIAALHERTMKRPRSGRNNEKALTELIKRGDFRGRYKRMNPTYNFMKKFIPTVYAKADKPLKVLHFLPSNQDENMKETALERFMYGKNGLSVPLMSERLINIFHSHGIK